jgi:hypothetical protein
MKYAIVIVLTALLVGFGVVAYFKGWLPTITFKKPQAVSVTNSEVSTPALSTPNPIASASPSASLMVVKAGGVLVFNAYTIDVPTGWSYTKEPAPVGEVAMDKLTLERKGGYKIQIFQAATGGAPCLYPGDQDQEGPSSRYTKFVDLVTATGDKLRRSSTDTGSGFTVCELQSGGYGQPTSFGHISIATPDIPSNIVMQEVDSILSSLKKI